MGLTLKYVFTILQPHHFSFFNYIYRTEIISDWEGRRVNFMFDYLFIFKKKVWIEIFRHALYAPNSCSDFDTQSAVMWVDNTPSTSQPNVFIRLIFFLFPHLIMKIHIQIFFFSKFILYDQIKNIFQVHCYLYCSTNIKNDLGLFYVHSYTWPFCMCLFYICWYLSYSDAD